METTSSEAEGLLGTIRPPRLEDAGLEDCALPPESIKEAFLKAATAVGSFGDDTSDGECVSDPWLTAKDSSDLLIRIKPGDDPVGPCSAEKGGGLPVEMGDKVVDSDFPERGEEACVDGLRGLNIGDKIRKLKNGDEEEEEEGEKPILAEAYEMKIPK